MVAESQKGSREFVQNRLWFLEAAESVGNEENPKDEEENKV